MHSSPASGAPGLVRAEPLFRRRALLLAAIGVLWLGTAVYLFARPPGSTAFLPAAWTFHRIDDPSARFLAGSLPSFAHAFGFSVLGALIGSGTPASCRRWCVAWAVVGVAFEFWQLSRFRTVAAAIVESHDGIPSWLALFFRYAGHGTFDPLDVFATLAGALVAYAVIASSRRPTRPDVAKRGAGPAASRVRAPNPSAS